MIRFLASFAIAALAFLAAAVVPAQAVTIEPIVTPSGIKAWLVREQATPLVALNFAFNGGSSQDSDDKSGTANMVASTIDEGAGSLDSKTFHEKLESSAIELRFQIG